MLNTLLAAGLLDDLGINLKVLGTQVVIFVITFLVLGRILFGRTLGFMERREEETRQAREAIERDRAEAARLKREYEEKLAAAEQKTYAETQEMLKTALAEAAKSVAEAQESARGEVQKARGEIQRERDSARTALREQVAELSLQVAERVLETKLDPAKHGGIVRAYLGGKS